MDKIFRLPKALISENGLSILKNHIRSHYPLHWHEFYELEYIVSGSGIYTLNGVSYPAVPGTLFFSTYMDFHDVLAREEIHTLTVEFDERWIDKTLFFDLYTSAVLENFDIKWLLKMSDALNSDDKYRLIYAEKLLNCILVEVCRKIETTSPAENSDGISKSVKLALQYIHLHFREDISVTKIAQRSGVSPNYFSKIFREQTGVTLKQHLTNLRIEYAKRLLQYSDMPITEVCLDSGFNSFSSFYRMFFEHTGMSPREYKKKICISKTKFD